MSKYFNETQKASRRRQKQSVTQELDIKQVLEAIRQGPPPGSDAAHGRLGQFRKVKLATGDTPKMLGLDRLPQCALEAYRMLRTRLMNAQAKSGLRSIAFTSSLPNEGKTFTVTNTGLCYSRLADQRVLMIDGDLRTYALTRTLGSTAHVGLGEVLRGEVGPDQAILATDRENLFVLPAGLVSTMSPPELMAGPRWQELLSWCSETFSVVLIDTPPILSVADFELISAACDAIVLVVRAGGADREAVEKARATVDSKKLLGVVLNAVDRHTQGYYGYAYSYATD